MLQKAQNVESSSESKEKQEGGKCIPQDLINPVEGS